MFLGWIYVSIQLFSSIWLFFGILTLFEWNFGLFYDIWRHIWRHNIVLLLQKVLNIMIQTSLSVLHPKKTHLYAVWDQRGHFNEISVVLGYFWIIWVILGVHDFTMGSRFQKFEFYTTSSVFPPQKTLPMRKNWLVTNTNSIILFKTDFGEISHIFCQKSWFSTTSG